MDLRKNEEIKGTICDLNDDGQGVLKLDSRVCFVPYCLVNENVTATIIFDKSNYLIAKATNISNESPDRTEPICPYFYKCGGCDIQHLKSEAQQNFKTQKVKNAFQKIANINLNVNRCISTNDSRYRNKIALPVDKDGNIGLYRKNTHSVIKIDDCVICEEWNKTLISIIENYIRTYQISCFDSQNNSGLIKHIVARKIENSIMITIVTNGETLPHTKELVEMLKQNFESFGLNQNINTQNNNVILSNKWKHIFGLKELTANEFNIVYPVSNASFFQVNNEIKTAIYSAVLDEISSDFDVVDAYSGAGLLSAIISKKANHCYGVEIIKEATNNANELKEKNNLKNLTFINGDCTKVIPKLIKSLKNKTIISLDPPRKGCDKKVLDAIFEANPEKIIYISCNPSTLARDCKILLQDEIYQITKIQPYDMFPQTSHVETLVVLTKVK